MIPGHNGCVTGLSWDANDISGVQAQNRMSASLSLEHSITGLSEPSAPNDMLLFS